MMSSCFLRGLTSLIRLALGLVLIAAQSLRAADAEVHPLQQRDQWQFEDPAAWEWQGDGDATILVLKRPAAYKPKVRRPFNMAWFGGVEWDSFTLTCEARLDVLNKGNNDLCIAFGGRGESEFYYAHLGETADAVHPHVHVVNQADRQAITTTRAKTLPWQPNHWHQVKLMRDAASGSIKVWFDDQVVLEASDKTFDKGRIGFGSFDDLGAFRRVRIVAGSVWRGNVLFADGEKKVIDFSEHDTWGDPLLIAPAPDAPPASFGLQPGSPARDAAIDGPLVSSLDLFGTLRPSAGKFDCGALQSSAAKVKTTDAAKGDKPPAKRKRSR